MATTLDVMQARQVRTASGLDVLAGLWLVVAPFIFNYSSNGGSVANDVAVGIAVLLLAGVQVTGDNYRYSWPSWANVLLGAWLLVSPFVLSFPSGSAAMWNDVVLGVVVGGLALYSAVSASSDTNEM